MNNMESSIMMLSSVSNDMDLFKSTNLGKIAPKMPERGVRRGSRLGSITGFQLKGMTREKSIDL